MHCIMIHLFFSFGSHKTLFLNGKNLPIYSILLRFICYIQHCMFLSSLEKDFCHCSDQTSDLQIDWIAIAISPFLVNCLLCETPLFSSKTAHPKIQTSPQKNKFCTKKLSKTSRLFLVFQIEKNRTYNDIDYIKKSLYTTLYRFHFANSYVDFVLHLT